MTSACIGSYCLLDEICFDKNYELVLRKTVCGHTVVCRPTLYLYIHAIYIVKLKRQLWLVYAFNFIRLKHVRESMAEWALYKERIRGVWGMVMAEFKISLEVLIFKNSGNEELGTPSPPHL